MATAARGAVRRAAVHCLACHGLLEAAPTLVAPDRMHGIPGEWPIHTCSQCGSGTTLPLAEERELAAFYPRDYAPFDLPRGPLATAMRLVQRARDSRFPLAALRRGRQPGRLLDVGCGRGDLAASWIDSGWEVIGIEPSADAAAVATARGADARVGTLATVELEPLSVDAALFRHSLEHVADPQLDLERVYRALRPGGRLAVIAPNWGSWQRRAFGEHWFPLELPRHRTHFTAEGLRAALCTAGFTGVVVRPATPLITTTWSLQFRLFDRCVTRAGVALLAGYAVSVPVALVTSALDAARGGGDFLHAVAERPC